MTLSGSECDWCGHEPCACTPLKPSEGAAIAAGVSDKYGRVYVEKVGNTGFGDPTEPVALLRAQDEHAYQAMLDYLRRNDEDPEVSVAQAASVRRQVGAFEWFRRAHPERIRKPGETR